MNCTHHLDQVGGRISLAKADETSPKFLKNFRPVYTQANVKTEKLSNLLGQHSFIQSQTPFFEALYSTITLYRAGNGIVRYCK